MLSTGFPLKKIEIFFIDIDLRKGRVLIWHKVLQDPKGRVLLWPSEALYGLIRIYFDLFYNLHR